MSAMRGRFGKVFKVAGILGAVVVALVLVAYLMTDVPMYLGRYEEVREKARSAGLYLSRAELDSATEFAEDRVSLARVPSYVDLPQSVNRRNMSYVRAAWKANEEQFPVLRSAISKLRVIPSVTDDSYRTLGLWRRLVTDKAKLAVVEKDFEEAKGFFGIAAELDRIHDVWAFGPSEFDKSFDWLLRTHWDDSKWLELAEKTLDQKDTAVDFESMHKVLHVAHVEDLVSYLDDDDYDGDDQSWFVKSEMLMPRYGSAVRAGAHSVFVDTLSMLPKNYGNRPTPIAELEDSLRQWEAYNNKFEDIDEQQPWKLVNHRIVSVSAYALNPVGNVLENRMACARYRSAIAFLRTHPKRNPASESRLLTILEIDLADAAKLPFWDFKRSKS